jgi:hypothetical protein
MGGWVEISNIDGSVEITVTDILLWSVKLPAEVLVEVELLLQFQQLGVGVGRPQPPGHPPVPNYNRGLDYNSVD